MATNLSGGNYQIRTFANGGGTSVAPNFGVTPVQFAPAEDLVRLGNRRAALPAERVCVWL